GRRQLVFVTGEPGIGKSELVGAFVQQLNPGTVIAGHGQCLDHHGVGEPYLPLIEKPDHTRETARMLLKRTGGNPLFMVGIINQLVAQSDLPTSASMLSIPPDVRRFIDRQIDNLPDRDRELLSAASVIRREFATAAVAAAIGCDIAKIEDDCARLARRGIFVNASGQQTWPDGTITELYTFRHDLYRELLYNRLAARRRALCHARVGSRLELAWSGRLDTIAAETAEHFERGGEPRRAISHHQLAAGRALRRTANREAILHLQRALNAIDHIADRVERTKIEVELRIALGAAFIAIRGFGAPEVLDSYKRADTLCDALGERTEVFPALWGQWMFHTGRGDTQASHHLCGRLLTLAEKFDDDALRIQ